MVRLTYVLARVPVIRFRKGGLGQPAAPPAASAGAAPAATPATSGAVSVSGAAAESNRPETQAMAILRIPKGVLKSSALRKELIALNLILKKN